MDSASDRDIVLYTAVPGGAVLLVVLVLCARALWVGPTTRSDHAYVAMLSPSVRGARNAFDRRVALAVREAKEGFEECKGCGFTNAKGATSCVLCGAGIERKGRFQRWKKPQTSEFAQGASSRQRRIRRRREWVRRVTADGSSNGVVWRRDSQCVNGTSRLLDASFVLQSRLRDSEGSGGDGSFHVQPEVTPEQTEAQDAVEICVVDEAPPRKLIEHVAQDLQKRLLATDVRVIDALHADASQVAFSQSHAAATFADSATNMSLDFPTKLAQFITSMASLFNETTQALEASGERAAVTLSINRASILSESIEAIATLPLKKTRGAIRVDFIDEQGIDAGGVYREWFSLLNEAIMRPEAGLFVCVDQEDQSFYLNPHSREVLGENHLAHYLAAGRLLGRALLEGNVTGFHLALPLLKIILGIPVGFSDLEYFDPEAYKNLKWLLRNEGVDMLGLDFTVAEKLPGGKSRVVELVSDGANLDVTDANKRDFVERKLKYHLFDSVSDQLFSFLTGLYQVIPPELLLLFDAEELDYVLSGSDEIDVDDWESHTVISMNLGLHPATENFWKTVRELSMDERRRLVQFATGSTRVPPGGFGALTSNDGRLCLFSLRGVPAKTTRGYLQSHACFNRLDLPMHGWRKDMRAAVHAAIAIDSIGFTTD